MAMRNSVTPVELQAADGVTLRGEAVHVSDRWLVLAHDHGDDLAGWGSLPARLAAGGVSTLAVDLRGHGLSDGEPSDNDAWEASVVADVRAALNWVQAQGARTVGLAGAGATASALMRASVGSGVAAVVLLTPDPPGEGAPRPAVAKLIIFGRGSAEATYAAHAWQSLAVGETILVDLPANEEGCALLEGGLGAHVGEHMNAFLARHLPVGPEEVARH
jgi:pimeloyl-ACP methyl ester carboxylesterase